MSISALLPILYQNDETTEVLFMDFSSMMVYDSSGESIKGEKLESVVLEMRAQQEASMPYVPRDQINEALKTERNIAKENEKHIFRRNY